MSPTILATILLATTASTNDGAILVLRDSNKPVVIATGSDVTHVALIFNHGGEDWVYEATPAKVRQITFKSYRAELASSGGGKGQASTFTLLRPKYPFSELQLERMRRYARSQIGRRYSIKGYLRDNEFDGVHCAQFASATLEASGRFHFDREYAITPGQLVNSVSGSYKSPVVITTRVSNESRSSGNNTSWCQQNWKSLFNYATWCKWACYETWTFCW